MLFKGRGFLGGEVVKKSRKLGVNCDFSFFYYWRNGFFKMQKNPSPSKNKRIEKTFFSKR